MLTCKPSILGYGRRGRGGEGDLERKIPAAEKEYSFQAEVEAVVVEIGGRERKPRVDMMRSSSS